MRQGVQVAPVLLGGGQERGLRSGSEDLASIVGMAAAADILGAEMGAEVARVQAIRDRLVERVLAEIPDSHLNGHPSERLPNNAHFRFDAVEGEAMVLSLRDAGHRRLDRLGLQLQDARAVAHAARLRAAARGGARLARVHLRALEHRGRRGAHHGRAARRDRQAALAVAALQDHDSGGPPDRKALR